MCGRYVSPDQAAVERAWNVGRHNSNPLARIFALRYNVAPQQGNPLRYVPIIREREDGTAEAVAVQWWLLPFWSKEPRIKYSTFNARVESVTTAASFREPFKRRRCLVPAAGWYEWQETPAGKQPWYIHPAHPEAAMLAGVWDSWERDGQVIESCAIIVGPANQAIASFHDRMPYVMTPDRFDAWLDRKSTSAAQVMELLQPVPDDALAFHRVSTRVSNARNDGAELIAPVDA
jgi:putative SOS response-associated peptidase YedK